jgi:hypothetical protein
MSERVLARRMAREMSIEEVEATSGGTCWVTQRTVCTTWDYGTCCPDERSCDAGMDCDF